MLGNASVQGAGRTCKNLQSLARYNMRKQEVLNLNVWKSWYFCTHSARAREVSILAVLLGYKTPQKAVQKYAEK